MFSPRDLLLALPFALAFGSFIPTGCGGSDSQQQYGAEGESVGTIEPTRAYLIPGTALFYGTWKADSVIGQFQSLVLLSDHRFHATRPAACLKAACTPVIEEGTFKAYSQDTHDYIEFEPKGRLAQTFEYMYHNDALHIRPFLDRPDWYIMNQSASAWCATPTDCDLQNLPPGICSGDYVCRESACAWQCPIGGPQ